MAELRVYMQIIHQDGEKVTRFPDNGHEPICIKTVGDRVEKRQFTIPADRDSIVTLWEYSANSAVYDLFALLNLGGSGVVNLAFEIVKPTSSTNLTPDGGWATFVSTLQQSCGAMLVSDNPWTEITTTRNLMGALDGSDPQPFASLTAAISSGYISKIKASNPGTTDLTIGTMSIWSDE